MTKRELINHLKELDPMDILTGTFYPLKSKEMLTIFSSGYEYVEIFADDGTIERPSYIPEQEPTLIGEAIQELEDGDWEDDYPIILTLGNEADDTVSSLGGVEWRDGELYLNTKTCPQQV